MAESPAFLKPTLIETLFGRTLSALLRLGVGAEVKQAEGDTPPEILNDTSVVFMIQLLYNAACGRRR